MAFGHEIKWDGYRISAYVAEGDDPTRNGHDWTKRFPAIAAAVAGSGELRAAKLQGIGGMTVGKRIQFDEETWAVVNLLRQERRRSFQQLADEAFADLLAKHGHAVDVKNQLRLSLGKEPVKRRKARKPDENAS